MMDWKKASTELQRPLDTAAIKDPPRGKFGQYVDGYHMITEANRIFGHDGWSYTITRLERASEGIVDLKGRDGPYHQYRCSYICTVQVNVAGVIREGAAVGVGNGKPENMGDVIESAVKEAETDALKRALRSLGNTFGLALYEKDESKRQVGNGAEINEAIADINAAPNGKALLAVMDRIGRLNNLDAVKAARIERINAIAKGAPSIEALDVMSRAFADDWHAVKQSADARKEELTQDMEAA